MRDGSILVVIGVALLAWIAYANRGTLQLGLLRGTVALQNANNAPALDAGLQADYTAEEQSLGYIPYQVGG